MHMLLCVRATCMLWYMHTMYICIAHIAYMHHMYVYTHTCVNVYPYIDAYIFIIFKYIYIQHIYLNIYVLNIIRIYVYIHAHILGMHTGSLLLTVQYLYDFMFLMFSSYY